ncbi:unnamed protein product [Agarophyton chilense]
MSNCVVCLTAPVTTRLLPCKHVAICHACCPRLETPLCPLCRARIYDVQLLDSDTTLSFSSLLKARAVYENRVVDTVAQVVVCSRSDAHAAALRYVSTVCALFPSKAVSVSKPPALRQVPYESRFAPNAFIDSTPVRLHVFLLPDRPSRQTLSALRSLRPDFLLMACLLSPRHSFHFMLNWDATLRTNPSTFPLPKRMWLFLLQPLLPLHKTSSPNLEFKEDVYHALQAMPLLFRPLTYHVVNPLATWTRPVKKMSKRIVYHVRMSRVLSVAHLHRPIPVRKIL